MQRENTRNSSEDEIVNVNFFMTTSSTTFTQCTPESTEFGEITQNKGHYTYISNKAFIKYTKYYFLLVVCSNHIWNCNVSKISVPFV